MADLMARIARWAPIGNRGAVGYRRFYSRMEVRTPFQVTFIALFAHVSSSVASLHSKSMVVLMGLSPYL